MPGSSRSPIALMAAVVTLVVCAACGTGASRATPVSSTGPAATPPATNAATAPGVYVAIGASDSLGLGSIDPAQDAWPVVFSRTALSPTTRLTNVAVLGATVAEALSDELPKALAAQPSIATVWLNVNDIRAGVPAADFERDLTLLVHRLITGGATRVLVANVPPLDQLPALAARPHQFDRAVADYNRATQRVTSREKAILVDLHAAGLAARAAGTEAGLVSSDGFHPSTAGYALVARTFADALRRAR